jgi:hypothetical protein
LTERSGPDCPDSNVDASGALLRREPPNADQHCSTFVLPLFGAADIALFEWTGEKTDSQSNTDNGDHQTYDPHRLAGVVVYRETQRVFSKGDHLQFTAPSQESHVANRELYPRKQTSQALGQRQKPAHDFRTRILI